MIVIVGKSTTDLTTGQMRMLAMYFIDIPMVGQAIKDNFDHLRFRTSQQRHSIRPDVDMRIVGCEHMPYLSIKVFYLFGFSQDISRLIREATAKRNKPKVTTVVVSSFSSSVSSDRERSTAEVFLEGITERRFSTLFCHRYIELSRTETVAEGVHNSVDTLKLRIAFF